jgi:hypothetical protein
VIGVMWIPAVTVMAMPMRAHWLASGAGAMADNGNRVSQAIFDNSSAKPSGRAQGQGLSATGNYA